MAAVGESSASCLHLSRSLPLFIYLSLSLFLSVSLSLSLSLPFSLSLSLFLSLSSMGPVAGVRSCEVAPLTPRRCHGEREDGAVQWQATKGCGRRQCPPGNRRLFPRKNFDWMPVGITFGAPLRMQRGCRAISRARRRAQYK